MNQKKNIVLTTTFIGLVCGFVLTQKQAAAATNAQDSTAASIVAPQSTAAATSAKSADPVQNEQPVDQSASPNTNVTNTNTVSEAVNQNQTPGTQSAGSPATTTTSQIDTANNNSTTSVQPQQAAAPNTQTISSTNGTNEAAQPVGQPTAPAELQASKATNNSSTTDSQVGTIAQGTWGTSKWEYTHQGDDYILHFHAGTLGASNHRYLNYFDVVGSIGSSSEVFNGNWQWSDALTQIIIDPGVQANQDSSYLFAGLEHLQKIEGLSNLDTTNVTNMSGMFAHCDGLTSLDLSHFNTAKVTDMSSMFEWCTMLTSLDLSNFDMNKVTNRENMIAACFDLNHLILGPETFLDGLTDVPEIGTKIPGTSRKVTSPYWVATSGYQQGHKYTSTGLMELTGRDQVTTYDWDSTLAFTQTMETQTKVRTINIYRPNGQVKTYLQTAVISRPVTMNADGSKTYGNWSTNQWEAYVVPELQGYTVSQTQVAAQAVDSNTTDQTIDIFYAPQEQTVEIQYIANGQIVGTQKITGYTGDTIMPNYHTPQGYEIISAAPATITIDSSGKQIVQVQVSPKLYYSNEHRIITRLINVHFPSGRIQTYEQTALLERPVTVNAVTGAKTYGSWNTGNWNAFNVPVLDGYTASQDQVAAQQVTDQDSDQTVDVYYITPITNLK